MPTRVCGRCSIILTMEAWAPQTSFGKTPFVVAGALKIFYCTQRDSKAVALQPNRPIPCPNGSLLLVFSFITSPTSLGGHPFRAFLPPP